MACIPMVAEFLEVLSTVPTDLATLPAEHAQLREDIMTGVRTITDAFQQALRVTAVRCGGLMLAAGEREEFNEQWAFTTLATDFLSYGVAEGFIDGRTKLAAVVENQGLSPPLRKLVHLVREKLDSERPGAQIAQAFGNLLRSGSAGEQGTHGPVPSITPLRI